MNKKGMNLSQAPQTVVLLVIIGVVLAIGLLILAGVGTSLTGDAALAIGNVTEAINNFAGLMPVLGTIFGAVLLLGAVVFLFVFASRRM